MFLSVFVKGLKNQGPRSIEFLYGIHPVLFALTFRYRYPNRLYIRSDLLNSTELTNFSGKCLRTIINLALDLKLPIVPSDSGDMGKLCNFRAHQGVILEASPIEVKALTQSYTTNHLLYRNILDMKCDSGFLQKHNRPIVLLLDHLTDVMNVGSIFRSAVFFGVYAVILSTAPCVYPSPLISKLSAGAMESLLFYRMTDQILDLKLLRDSGFLMVGTAGKSRTSSYEGYCKSSTFLLPSEVGLNDHHGTGIHPRPLILAIGNEAQGLSSEVLSACDLLVRIPGSGDCENDLVENEGETSTPSSLNVAVATGIVLYHLTMLRHGVTSVGQSALKYSSR